jgi:micrococcal nuclease
VSALNERAADRTPDVRTTLVCVAALLAACSADSASAPSTILSGAASPTGANAEIDRVVDGDTVDVVIDGDVERVRLIGIDTPETVKPDSPVECFGPEASAFTERLLAPGTPVRLERDVEARDDYGRLLAYVYLPAGDGGTGVFVNLEIVRQGYASLLTFPPNVAHVDEFVEAARAAEEADLGLWAACGG